MLKASYTAAEAQTHISEAVSGISEEMGDVGIAMQRAEDKTAGMQARAQALDELIDSGVLHDATLPTGQRDDIQAALDAARDFEATCCRLQLVAKAVGVLRRTRHAPNRTEVAGARAAG